jgi:beta-glucosidase
VSHFRVITLLCLVSFAVLVLRREAISASDGPKPFSSFDEQVKPLLEQMTLDEKIGQMTQPDMKALQDDSDVEKLFLGSVLSGGDSDPKEGNSLEAWTNLYDRLQTRTRKTRLGIPILYGVDAVHGHNNVLGAVIFPHNIGLGASRDLKLIEQVARVTAEEVRATGINWTFAPCVAAPQDIRWGRTYEGYTEDPWAIRVEAAAAVRGLQGADLSNPLAVLATAKHFLGDGGTTFGTGVGGKGLDQGDVRVGDTAMERIHARGYIAAIQAGVGSVMVSYSSWNGVKCTASKRLITAYLKKQLKFDGFVVSDYDAINQVAPDYKKAVETSINAGIDMAMVTDKYRVFIQDLKDLVNGGQVPMARIDDAVTRILRVKFAMGLMDKNRSPLADRKLWKTFGSAEHRQVARQAVRQSLVLLKNDNNALPLSKTAARIHVAGKNADNLGNQCGGWTIDWQGKSGNVTTGGTTILAAIKTAASPKTKVTFSLDGSGAAGADIGVVVIGEKPYAEYKGDSSDLSLDPEDVEAVNNVKKAGIPVVVVLISGRPMIVKDILPNANAFVAAWLPGTEGEGVADVLFGDFNPTGRLPFSWPNSMAQIPININQANYQPLYKVGFGLNY